MHEDATIPDDAAILGRIARGDLEYFDVFVNRYKQRLLGYVCRRIGDRHRAEDITQDVFLRAFRAVRADGYRGGSCAASWLFTIARNCVVDYLRARREEATLHADFSDQPARRPEGAAAEGSERVQAIMSQLPEPQREVVALKVFCDLTFGEIGQVMDCSVSTAKSRMRYGLEKIRELLVEDGRAPQ